MMADFDLQAALQGMMNTPLRRVKSPEELFSPLDRIGTLPPIQEEPPAKPEIAPAGAMRGITSQAVSGAISPIMGDVLAQITGASGRTGNASFAPVETGSTSPPGLPSDSQYAPIADRIAQEQGVDPALVRAVITQESGWNARAVSPVGAQGMMQLMPGTARRLGVNDPFDPEQNIRGGVAFLKWLLDKYGGDETLALAAYNAGPAAVDEHGGIPPYEETHRFVKSVRGMAGRP